MTPNHLAPIRHAEEHETMGVAEDGSPEEQSMMLRGWQRAGALARLFYPAGRGLQTPNTVIASSSA
jgi:hypothetical protein